MRTKEMEQIVGAYLAAYNAFDVDVDRMSEAIGEPDVLDAIVKVITFVKARDAAKENGD